MEKQKSKIPIQTYMGTVCLLKFYFLSDLENTENIQKNTHVLLLQQQNPNF